MTDQEVLTFFKKNPFRYVNFREIAKALNWDFPHDIFDDVPVQCIVYQPSIRPLLVSEIGKGNTRLATTGCSGCFVDDLRTVFINLHTIEEKAHYYLRAIDEEAPNHLYGIIKTTIEHEYLHAYFWHTNVLRKYSRPENISKIRKAFTREYPKGTNERAWIDYYNRYYKRMGYFREEEFLIQLYTTRFEFGEAAGSHHLDKLMDIMKDVHPYFARAKMPKHLAKKLERIHFG